MLTVAGRAPADTVKLANKPAFRNVVVTDFRDLRLVFRGVSRQYLHKPLDEVEWLTIDGRSDFNSAEQAAATEAWTAAVAHYESALSAADAPWLQSLIRVRFLGASQRAGRFDRAVALYVGLLNSGILLPPRYTPANPGPIGSDINRRARTTLETALAASPAPVVREALRTLQLELLLFEDVDPLPADLIVATTATRPTASRPSHRRPVGILPEPEDDAPPPPARATPPPTLHAESLVLKAARAAADSRDFRRAARLLERGLAFVATSDRGPWRLLFGRCRIELGDYAPAAADLLDLAETESDPARSAEALYYVAQAHERMGRGDVARRLYHELLQRTNAPEYVKTRARAALEQEEPSRPQ